ncbi:BatD [Cystobacter fuscus DSM 2262]|uniref:BatD n=1 Tax=Cystobacter fuscus (strain ATCC 25194 / DSM 2262 / NBRC 100088 / M29) TaxID=1242864 RepID=S9PKR6_CYSF2|nr:BatD family protein [Cystobacter fuscus]EPX63047.1 BatD [Cystobacter fuscus DSM 2262]
MRRIGSGHAALAAIALLFAALPAWAEVEFYQTVDRTEVGTEDVFQLTVVVVDPPDNAQVQFPAPEDFEVLSSSQSTQRSIQMSGGGPPVIQTVRKHVLMMRAQRAGNLTLPPAVLSSGSRTWRTDSIKMTVRKGRVSPPAGQAQAGRQRMPDPFRNFPPFGGMQDPFADEEEEEEDPRGGIQEDVRIPRGDSDLFVRATLDKKQAYVGEQVTLSLYIYSRVDLSSVDSVSMPKLEGFWSEDVESPTQLTGEQRIVNGIPYRTYLLRRRALFPMKTGTLSITPAEADITTGMLFVGHRVHRVSNPLEVEVKPLPPGGPKGMSTAQVGDWKLSVETSQQRVELGQPVTVKVILEGSGNVKNITPPRLEAPPAFKVYDPTTTDKMTPNKLRVQGRRTQEYLVMPQRTGTFTLPALEFPYFDPKTGRYEVSRTEPVEIVVEPGAGGAVSAQAGSSAPMADAAAEPKNVLTAGGLRPLRYQARFEAPAAVVWQRPFFLPAVLAPVGLMLALALGGLVRGRWSAQDEGSRSRQRARAARKQLAAAEKLRAGNSSAFYGEVEKALLNFLAARLRIPVGGLTRDALNAKLTEAGVEEARRQRVRFVLEACDTGRFAPGAEPAARERILDDAAAVMEGWDK